VVQRPIGRRAGPVVYVYVGAGSERFEVLRIAFDTRG